MLFSALLLSLFLEYVNPGGFIPVIGATKIGTIIPLLVFVLAVLQPRPTTNRDLFQHSTTKWLLFFLFLLFLSTLISEVTLYSFHIFKDMLANVFFYIMIVKLVTDKDKLIKVLATLVWIHVVLIGLNPAVVLEPETRSYLSGGFFLGDGNDFALSVCITWPMCIAMIRISKSRMAKGMYIGILAVLTIAIIGTQSRGATLALAGLLGVLWWHSRHKFAHLLLVAIAVLGVVSLAPPKYFERMESIAEYEEDTSAMGRIAAWRMTFHMVKKHPLTGVGSGHFPAAIGGEFRPPEWGDSGAWRTAHSMYFLVLGELGIPGFVCFMALLVGSYFRLRGLRQEAMNRRKIDDPEFSSLFLMLTASLVGFGISGTFLSVTYYPHLYILSGIVVAAALVYKRSEEESDNERNSTSRVSHETPGARRSGVQ